MVLEMPENVFYADLDIINGKGVFVTGHGKGLVNKNPNINGEYISNDMVCLTAKNGELFGYQGYVKTDDNDLTRIEYLLYFFAPSEPNQPQEPVVISIDNYLLLSKHNIDTGARLKASGMAMFGKPFQNVENVYREYEKVLKQAHNVCCMAVPFTKDENDRALFVTQIIK